MITIKSNTVLKSRSIFDYNCIFELKVIGCKGTFATVIFLGKEKRTKIYNDGEREYVKPEKYSMAPTFYAN